jgi:flagellar biosynthesis protein FlhG
MTRIITVTSGRPGVGKTTITFNLAAQLAALGHRVCLLDADPGRDDVAKLLGDYPASNLQAFVTGDAAMDAVCRPSDEGFDWVPGGSNSGILAQLLPGQLQRLADGISSLHDYDFILIDAAASLHANVLGLSLSSSELLLVLDTENESLSESYALLKVLFAEAYSGQINILINKTINHTLGRYSYSKFREVAGFYLNMQLPLAGMIAIDPLLADSSMSKGSLLKQGTVSPASRDIEALAHRLINEAAETESVNVAEFGRHYLCATGLQVPDVQDGTLQPPSWRHDEEPAGLHDQLEQLSDQVDTLIAEVDQLRRKEPAVKADLLALQQPDPEPETEQCSETCIAAMASYTETCTVQGDTFSVYRLSQPNGRMQRFACHSMDDDLQEPEPQTTSS